VQGIRKLDVFYCMVSYVVFCSVLQCVAVCCSVLQCVAVCCSVLQCAAVCCSVADIFYCMVSYVHLYANIDVYTYTYTYTHTYFAHPTHLEGHRVADGLGQSAQIVGVEKPQYIYLQMCTCTHIYFTHLEGQVVADGLGQSTLIFDVEELQYTYIHMYIYSHIFHTPGGPGSGRWIGAECADCWRRGAAS